MRLLCDVRKSVAGGITVVVADLSGPFIEERSACDLLTLMQTLDAFHHEDNVLVSC
jgi:hypothetical protein